VNCTAGCFKASLTHITSLTQKLNPGCTLKITWNSNGCPLPCMFFGNDFYYPSVFSLSHCALTKAVVPC